MLILSALTPDFGPDSGAKFAFTESTRSDTTRTVTQQGSSTMTEEKTSVQSQWKFEATIPFSSADWAQLSQNGTLSVKVGRQVIEKEISAKDGFDPKSNSFKFKLSRPVVAYSGFKYLTLPTDPPAAPAPAPGTRVIYGQGSLEFKNETLKISLSSSGKAAPALAAENFVAVGDGNFEGKLPIELAAGSQRHESELNITGTAKHKDRVKDSFDNSVVGRTVQLSIDGKAG